VNAEAEPFVQTVTGPIPARELSFTLSHEHVGIGSYSRHARDPWDKWALINDEDLLADELERFKAAGGSCIVDLTNIGLGRNPERILRLSERTGVPIVMGCGWYRGGWGAPEARIDQRSTAALTDALLEEFEEGIGPGHVRPGVIGEIGTDRSWVNAEEERVFRAVARASRRTGLGIMCHAMRPRVGTAELDVLLEEGADPGRIVIGHVDLCPHLDYHLAMLERGASIEYDFLGQHSGRMHDAVEPRLIDLLIELLDRGYAGQLMLSHDFGIAFNLHLVGGNGYTYLHDSFLPKLRARGVDDATIDRMMVLNPRRILALESSNTGAAA
jgi:predicted metal-dependent phosphotriesterase family hydrolase